MRILYALIIGSVINLAMPAIAQDSTGGSEQIESPYSQTDQLTPEELEQQRREAEEAAEQACAVCGGSMAMMILVLVAAIVLNIALLIWVARDAKSRSMDSSVLWMFLVMCTGPLGLIIYIFSRPQGQLTQCPSCNGKRLRASAKCPHCQNP